MAKITCNFISYTLKRTVDITVVIPTPTIPESIRRFEAEKKCRHTPVAKYPVLYLLHGMGNNHATWTGYTNVEMYAEERQIAVVNMSAENKCYITDGDDDWFTFLSEELPDFVCGLFPISDRPEDTFIAGLSMGGFGTLVHALNHPERFAALGAFSAAVLQRRMSMTSLYPGRAFGAENPADRGELEAEFSPYKLAERIAAEGRKFPKVYMACGLDDGVIKGNIAFRDKLIELGADVTWDEIEGYGHEWRFWDIEVERFLDWIPRTDSYALAGKRRI